MKRGVVLVVTGIVLVVSVSTPAVAAIRITKINFDPSGPDDDSNLIREHVVIKNTSWNDRSIRGWRVHDAGRDHVYRFGRITLGPHECAIVVTGTGEDFQAVNTMRGCRGERWLHWGLDNYVWNNDGDRASIQRPNGTIVDRCAYTASADSPVAC